MRGPTPIWICPQRVLDISKDVMEWVLNDLMVVTGSSTRWSSEFIDIDECVSNGVLNADMYRDVDATYDFVKYEGYLMVIKDLKVLLFDIEDGCIVDPPSKQMERLMLELCTTHNPLRK